MLVIVWSVNEPEAVRADILTNIVNNGTDILNNYLPLEKEKSNFFLFLLHVFEVIGNDIFICSNITFYIWIKLLVPE